MAIIPDLNKVPTMYLQSGLTKANVKNGNKTGLKDKHISFTGYGMNDDEIVVFGDSAFYDKPGTIKFVPTYAGSRNESALVLVTRVKGDRRKTDWFNLGVLSRTMNQADGKSIAIDEFRQTMIDLGNDEARLEAVAGKAITITGSVNGFTPKFNRTRDANGKLSFEVVKDDNGNRVMDSQEFNTIDFCDLPAEEKPASK